ncbi:MAG TPA: DUF5941 domain-containing protein [Capillimicrobium sp.]|nr:DUF5941 domain-containing protein [Capillimicrobium sp.]
MSSVAGATATAPPPPTPERSAIWGYRDDGPLANAIGRSIGWRIPVPPIALVLAGLVPLLVSIAVEGDDASDAAAGAAIAWMVLMGSLASGRRHQDALRWAVPPMLRVAEFASILWIGSLDGALPAAFAFLCVVSFRVYDLVYRLRYRASKTPDWLVAVALGWDGRILLAFVLLVAGLLPAGLYVAAALLAAVLAGESVRGWVQFLRAQRRPVLYEDEEDEAA